jgi:hypothetical protein
VVLSPKYQSIASVREASPQAADELDALCQELMPLLESPNYIPYDPEKANEWGWLANHHHAVQMFPHILINSCDVSELEIAVNYALAIMRLADMQSRGALDGDTEIGVFMRRRALRLLAEWPDKLSPAAMRKLMAALQQSIHDREDPEVSWGRGLAYKQYHWSGWVLNLERIFGEQNERRRFVDNTLVPERRQELAKRLLQAELAVRLYSQERGELPKSLNDVVPDYLMAVPVDLNRVPLELRRDADGEWSVHCVGWGGVHDGGSFFDPPQFPQAEGIGIDLDYLSRQQF